MTSRTALLSLAITVTPTSAAAGGGTTFAGRAAAVWGLSVFGVAAPPAETPLHGTVTARAAERLYLVLASGGTSALHVVAVRVGAAAAHGRRLAGSS